MSIHYYEPMCYYNTIGPHEPIMRIKDGDTVVTSTVDAWGQDSKGMKVAERSNPQTGPFFIENAEPGDVLAVHFDSITPNRDWGFSKTVVAPNVVDPEFVSQIPETSVSKWSIDTDRNTTVLISPELKLKGKEFIMSPMLGCFGVAPSNGQFITTDTSGQYGGNMDYSGFTEGTNVYLPVFTKGALFFIGDGHAVQGDGEIVGTGIETSFSVRFTVKIIKCKKISWPRGENEEYIFTVGNARPLDQALQHATTEMIKWLMDDYGFDCFSASILLGQCVKYDIGNVYDPAYTVVCKVPKKSISE